MEIWQKLIVTLWGISSLALFFKGFVECKDRNNSYKLTPYLFIYGIIAWGDAVIFGVFWFVSSTVVLLLNDWVLFLLIISVFWLVRSLGETIYWFNQQFSKINRNPPEKYWFYKFFHNDSVWYIHQIAWQCISVLSVIASIYFTNLWLKSL